MTKDDTEIVSALLLALADKVGKERYELWFGSNVRIALAADALYVSVPNQFYQDWLRTNFRRPLEECLAAALGRDVPVVFRVGEDLLTPRGPAELETPASGVGAQNSGPPEPAPPLAASEPRGERPCARRRFADLESFVAGPANRLAAVSAAAVVEQLGRTSPLLIHGPTSVGKTHLLEGIWTAAKRRHPRLHAVYLSAEQFTSHFLEALHASGVPNFRNKYRGVELLLIDDLQFFAGKRATLGELLYTIDALTREGRQLVFAADRPPASMAGLGQELSSRLAAGLVCRIDPPDYDTRRGIVRRHAARLELQLGDDVLDYVAANFRDHARELIGALVKLHATSRAMGGPITLPVAEQALAESAGGTRGPVKLVDVQQAVCEVFGLAPDSLRSNRRTTAIAHPRMLAMWLARKHTRAALAEIGEFFGRRSHTTVISANKKVGLWMSDPRTVKLADHTLSVEEAVRKVEERLRAG